GRSSAARRRRPQGPPPRRRCRRRRRSSSCTRSRSCTTTCRRSTTTRNGEGVGILAGDALLAEAFRLATSYDTPHVARELAEATLGMIGGQYLDITGSAPDEQTLHKLKTGRLFDASVALALWAAHVPAAEQAPWRAF